MRQYEMAELAWQGEEPEGSWADVCLDAVFSCGGWEKAVRGFYAGNSIYKVRFLPERAGKYFWRVTGEIEAEGEAVCEPACCGVWYAGEDPHSGGRPSDRENRCREEMQYDREKCCGGERQYSGGSQYGAEYRKAVSSGSDSRKLRALEGAGHGPVRACGRHFMYEDGTRYTPVGTTVYALAHQPEALIRRTLKTLSEAPFNKVRYCIFPKSYDYNHNEPELFAFHRKPDGTWDVNRPCMEFWEHFERIITELDKMGIQSDLILFHPYDRWGFAELSMEENRIYLDYLLRRLAAFPSVWWSMANEYDLMFQRGISDWYELEEYIAAHDPYGHLLSNHQCIVAYDFGRKNVTHCCLQLRDVNRAKEFSEKYQKPVIYDELAYEGNLPLDWGNISGFELADRLWSLYAQGAYGTHGEVFLSDDEVLWWAKGGILKGESPARIAFLKTVLQEADGPLEAWNLLEFAEPGEGFSVADMLRGVRKDNPLAELYYFGEGPEKDGMFRSPEYAGRYGTQFFLRYFGRTCPGLTTLYLPEDRSYQVEVIDIWEMTKTRAYFGASGKTRIRLPGKEGIAVLATAL